MGFIAGLRCCATARIEVGLLLFDLGEAMRDNVVIFIDSVV